MHHHHDLKPGAGEMSGLVDGGMGFATQATEVELSSTRRFPVRLSKPHAGSFHAGVHEPHR